MRRLQCRNYIQRSIKDGQVFKEEIAPVEVREIYNLQEDHPGRSGNHQMDSHYQGFCIHQCRTVTQKKSTGSSLFLLVLFWKVSD